MALDEYKRRRNFRKTPEPQGTARADTRSRPARSFVVQKHAARRLHYDFRLELDGVLKSWAIPKGPSLDPAEKRLAVEVEDHPLEYGGFEGIIPKGEYGGGTVLLWDRGTWEPLEPDPAAAYRDGMLKFTLNGEKLHGHWMLVRLKRKPRDTRDNWLLVKERDAAAVPGSGTLIVEEYPLSVESGRAVDAIAAERDRVWHSNRIEAEATLSAAAPGIADTGCAQEADAREPQAAAGDGNNRGSGWPRMVARDQTRRLPAARLDRARRGSSHHPRRARLDPEILGARKRARGVAGSNPRSSTESWCHSSRMAMTSFAALQDAIATGRTDQLTFFAFDLLYRDGWDLTATVLRGPQGRLGRDRSSPSDGTLSAMAITMRGKGRRSCVKPPPIVLRSIVSEAA